VTSNTSPKKASHTGEPGGSPIRAASSSGVTQRGGAAAVAAVRAGIVSPGSSGTHARRRAARRTSGDAARRRSARTGVPTFHPRERFPLRGSLSAVPSEDDSALDLGATARRRMRARCRRVTRACDVWRVAARFGARQNLDARGAKFSAWRRGKGHAPDFQNTGVDDALVRAHDARHTRARLVLSSLGLGARLVSHRRSRRPNLARLFRLTRAFASDRRGTLVCRFAH
jgi:hypothetical protein